jgi:hypothetical protein
MDTAHVEVVELTVEELEEIIASYASNTTAPATCNHNETLEVDLEVEELEEVIAPGATNNHNETLVADA